MSKSLLTFTVKEKKFFACLVKVFRSIMTVILASKNVAA